MGAQLKKSCLSVIFSVTGAKSFLKMAHVMKGALRLTQAAARNNLLVTQQRNYTPPDWVRKYMYNLSGWNQYVLYKDDLMVENEDVQEAIRRLPPTLQEKVVQNSTCYAIITYEDGFAQGSVANL